MSIEFKIPDESPDYSLHSAFVIEQIASIIKDAIESGRNRIFIHTNLKRGLPLENINKVAGPFVEAWAMEQFEMIADNAENIYQLIHAESGRRLDPFDIVLQFKIKNWTEYVSADVDVKATAEDIASSGKSPNITSYARIRSEYVNDPDYIFIVLSLKHKVFSERFPETGMTNGVMEVVSYSVYDLKYISERDLSYNPALELDNCKYEIFTMLILWIEQLGNSAKCLMLNLYALEAKTLGWKWQQNINGLKQTNGNK